MVEHRVGEIDTPLREHIVLERLGINAPVQQVVIPRRIIRKGPLPADPGITACFHGIDREAELLSLLEDFHLSYRDVPYEQRELLQLIQASLELLPEDYREAFVLREYNGLSYNEIAEVIGESLDVVKVRIFRAKKKLRDILAPYLADLHSKA